MLRSRRTVFFIALSVMVSLVATGFTVLAQQDTAAIDAERAELQRQIDERNKQLQVIQQQLQEARNALNSTATQRKSLQSEVGQLERNIRTLELSIRDDELSIQKLGFEIVGLNQDIGTIKEQVAKKQDALGVLLREVQRNDRNNALVTLLRTKSLAESIREARTVGTLQVRMTSDIDELRQLQDQMLTKLDLTNNKRNEIEDRQEDLSNRKAIVEDQKTARRQVLVQTQSKESSYQQQVSQLQAEQKKIAQEVEAIDAALRAKINKSTLPSIGTGVLGVPIPNGKAVITQGYGSTAFAKYGYAGQWHNGLDMGAPVGTPIYAAEAGTVAAAGNQDAYCPRGAYGRFIVISHTNGLTTLYGHMSRQVVAAGQAVERGQLIGYVGQTGYATGPHLHFTVYASNTFSMGPSRVCGPMPKGGDVNPLQYL